MKCGSVKNMTYSALIYVMNDLVILSMLLWYIAHGNAIVTIISEVFTWESLGSLPSSHFPLVQDNNWQWLSWWCNTCEGTITCTRFVFASNSKDLPCDMKLFVCLICWFWFCQSGEQCQQAWDFAWGCSRVDRSWFEYLKGIYCIWWWMVHGWWACFCFSFHFVLQLDVFVSSTFI